MPWAMKQRIWCSFKCLSRCGDRTYHHISHSELGSLKEDAENIRGAFIVPIMFFASFLSIISKHGSEPHKHLVLPYKKLQPLLDLTSGFSQPTNLYVMCLRPPPSPEVGDYEVSQRGEARVLKWL